MKEIQNSKSKIQNRKRAFVLIAALGVMAVGLLLAFAMSASVQFTYYRTGAAIDDIQERLMGQSVAAYALQQIARDETVADGKPRPFVIPADRVRGSTISGELRVSRLAPDHAVYGAGEAIKHRPGDVLIDVRSPGLAQRGHVLGHRVLLCNTTSGRIRPIDLTQLLRSASTGAGGSGATTGEVK